MNDYSFNSVEIIPDLKASAAFTVNSSEVFKEQVDMLPHTIDEGFQYMPWGADNEMPYKILELIESDETLSTCQIFNAEVCYGSGLVYDSTEATSKVQQEVKDFLMDNDLASYFLGVCQDFKHLDNLGCGSDIEASFMPLALHELSALPSLSSSSMATARRSCAFFVRRPATAALHPPRRTGAYRIFSTRTGARASPARTRWRRLNSSTAIPHGLTYRSAWQQSVLADTYFSQEQMDVFRQHVMNQMRLCHPLEEQVIRSLQSLEMMLVSDMQVHNQSFYDLVIILEHEEFFFMNGMHQTLPNCTLQPSL